MHPSPGKCLIAVLILALAVRLAAGWAWQGWLDRQERGPFGMGDSDGYWRLARTIAHGEPYQYGPEGFRVFRTPGYPVLLAPLTLLEPEDDARPPVMWFRALSAILDTAAVALVGWVAWRLFNAWAGVLAAGMAAVYPGSIAVGVLVLSEAPFCPLLLVHLGLWMAAWKTQSRWELEREAGGVRRMPPTVWHTTLWGRCDTWCLGLSLRSTGLAFAAGLAAGAATLMRPSWLLFAPFATIVGMVVGRPRLRHFKIWLFMATGLAVAMIPWWVRNAQVTCHGAPTTLQVGASLYDGLNPEATGASDFVPVQQAERELLRQESGTPCGDWEYQLDAGLRREAVDWAWSHPGRAAELAGIKFVRMWNVWPNEPGMSAWPIRLGVAVCYVPILVLGLWGAIRTARRGWPYLLCWLPAVYFTLLHMVFVSSIRYRQPAMLGLIVLAAGMLGKDEGGRMKDE
jgi:4-amino-4-deoxy-L-arabinose transferase-like glycosyltransferase